MNGGQRSMVRLCLILITFLAPNLASCGEKPAGKIFFLSGGELFSIRPDGTDRASVIDGILDRQVAVSPDGGRIAYLGMSDGGESLSLLDLAAGRTIHVYAPQGEVLDLEWSRQGDHFAVVIHEPAGTVLLIAGRDGARERLVYLGNRASTDRFAAHWHPNGRQILISDGEIRLYDPDTAGDVLLGLGYDARYDPEGREILFVDRARGYLHDRDPAGGWYVGMLEPGEGEQRLRGAFGETGIPENYFAPIWSPGGDQIAMMFDSVGALDFHDPRQVLYVVNRDGSTANRVGRVYPAAEPDGPARQPNWLFSADGRHLVCALFDSVESSQLAVIDLEKDRRMVIDEKQRAEELLWLDQVHFVIAWIEE